MKGKSTRGSWLQGRLSLLLGLLLLATLVQPAALLAQDEDMSGDTPAEETPPPAPAASFPACPPAGSTVELTGAGATFPAPIYTRWFADYATLCGVRINYQAIGSGGGINQHTQRTVQFGASDGILTQAQKDAAPGTLMIPTVAGSVTPVVNIQGIGPGQVRLTPDVLASIYLGEITRWNDQRITSINPGVNLPGADIIVVRRSDGSGTTNVFTSYLSAVSPAWQSRVGAGNAVNWPTGLGGEGNAGVAGQVRQLPGAIGYVELAYARQNNMAWTLMQNSSGQFVAPTLESTTAAMEGVTIPDSTEVMIVNSSNPNAFPIAGFTWILVYQDQPDANVGRSLASMLWWALHDGQATAPQLDYSPLSPTAQRAGEDLIRRISSGGQPLLQ